MNCKLFVKIIGDIHLHSYYFSVALSGRALILQIAHLAPAGKMGCKWGSA